MRRYFAIALCAALIGVAFGVGAATFDWGKYQPPDWRKYQAPSTASDDTSAPAAVLEHEDNARVTFHDLKLESDKSLALRLLGAVGQRIAYVDRHKDRWRYYRGDNSAAEDISLYTHPSALGSQYGLCGVEKYSIDFDDAGHVTAVSVTEHYGVEGAVFQKSGFDWGYYYKLMCSSAPASHAPSYFPSPDDETAKDVAMLLVSAIDLAASSAPLPYRLECRAAANRPCSDNIRGYISHLRLGDINRFSAAGCPQEGGPKSVCFTLETGDGRLGPFPKMLTVKGSVYLNNVRVGSVTIAEGFTMS